MARLRTPKALGTLALGAAAVVAAPDADAQVAFVEPDPSPFDGIEALESNPDSAVKFADYDGDGDFDFIFSDKYGSFTVYQNVGTPTDPAFVKRVDPSFFEPFGLDINDVVLPSFADLDDDGDLDVVLTTFDGIVRYFENVGTPTKLRVEERFGAGNPFSDFNDLLDDTVFADLDDDGDLDLIGPTGARTSFGTTGVPTYFENVGTPEAPLFAQRFGEANPFDEIGSVNGFTFGDGDGDGDLDLVAGISDSFQRTLRTYRNVGTPTAPRFVLLPIDRDPFGSVTGTDGLTPALVDLDADGDLDLAFGSDGNGVRYFENVTIVGVRAGKASLEAVSVPLPAATRDGDGALLAWAHSGPDATYEVHRLLGSAGAFDLLGTVSAKDGEAVRFHTGPLGDAVWGGTTEVRLRRVEADGRSAYGPSAEVRTGLAGTHELGEVYPNPTAAGAQFTLRVAEAQEVRVRVYDAAGRHVTEAFSGRVEAGIAERVEIGQGLSAGVYFVRVLGEQFADVQRLTVLPE
ncbi:MAG: T9SS type A sorting domain-containing protein [Bacteroidota bacterium]